LDGIFKKGEMVKAWKICLWICLAFARPALGQTQVLPSRIDRDTVAKNIDAHVLKQFLCTSDFFDAAVSSINSFNSLIKKENYRIRITAFNNPTSSDMGFNLESEIQIALKPVLAKAKNTNTTKFSEVVSSLMGIQNRMPLTKTAITAVNPVFTTLVSLVGTLTIQEKKITREDLDSFIAATSKYFVQYEKLNQANIIFDQNIERLNAKLTELQFDSREYIMDQIIVLNKNLQRSTLKLQTSEELLLKYLDKEIVENCFHSIQSADNFYHYPSDGIKNAKEVANAIQKLFNEYQRVYSENYQQIRNILLESKSLGGNVNIRQVEASLKELEELYNESRNSDILGLRLSTLFERLKSLVATEQFLADLK
jgi:hypothetical protein